MITWNRVSTFAKKTPVLVTGASVCSFAAGAAAAYFLTEKKVSREYQKYVEKEIQQAKEYYRRLNKRDEYASPRAAASALGIYQGKEPGTPIFDELPDALKREILEEQDRILSEVTAAQPWSSPPDTDDGSTEDTDDLTAAVENVFENADRIDTDYELEIAGLGPLYPHVISAEEYLRGESGLEQVSLTYYEGDEALADAKDGVIPDIEKTIGLINLRFGYRSDDENIVYIRNPELHLEFEVARSFGKYSVEVMGFDDPDEHQPRRRSRGDDG